MKEKNNTIVFIILTGVCLVLIVASSIRASWFSPVRTGVGYVLMPLQKGVSEVGRAVYDKLTEHDQLQSALEENASLRDTIDQLVAENTRLEQDNFELQRLRNLYKLDEQYRQYPTVGARVVAKDSAGWFDIFRIDKGSNDGIKKDMNVMADGGLVGIVTDVGANYSTVRSIIDDSSRVSAMTIRSNDTSMVSGSLVAYSNGRLLLEEIAIDADIKEGDKIVTSNVSSKFLPGILIGYATDIKKDSNNLTMSGYLIPVAKFETLQEVLIITELKEEAEK